MELTSERRKDTGAFYTPKMWAEKAMDYIEKVIPYAGTYWREKPFVFYDPAAGEGALLDAIGDRYGGAFVSGTTLEEGDVEILRQKGYRHVKQLDFLEYGSLLRLLPPIVQHASNEGRLVVVTNPPFMKLTAGKYDALRKRYGTNDATALFLYRIFCELNPVLVCSFHKLDLLQAPAMKRVREDLFLYGRLSGFFICPSRSWGLKGDFPIAFCMYLGAV